MALKSDILLMTASYTEQIRPPRILKYSGKTPIPSRRGIDQLKYPDKCLVLRITNKLNPIQVQYNIHDTPSVLYSLPNTFVYI